MGTKFCCPHALADSNQHIWIRQKTLLEFSSTVLSVSVPVVLTDQGSDVFMHASVFTVPSVLRRCWLGGRKGIRPVKN